MKSAGCLLVYGYGYSAAFLAQDLRRQGWRVIGTSRDAEKRRALTQQDLQLIAPEELPQYLPHCTHLLCAAPPENGHDPLLEKYAVMLAGHAWSWVGYFSSTAVYGDWRGAWVDEDTLCRPTTQRARIRLKVEEDWQSWAQIWARAHNGPPPLSIFRLAGIYGPERSVLEQLRQCTARRIDRPQQFFNRIHVADIAGLVQASMAQLSFAGIFNAADDLPANPAEVVAYAAQLLDLPVPRLIPWAQAQSQLSPMALEFYADNKRVRNNRARERLGYAFRFPSYLEGLRACLAP